MVGAPARPSLEEKHTERTAARWQQLTGAQGPGKKCVQPDKEKNKQSNTSLFVQTSVCARTMSSRKRQYNAILTEHVTPILRLGRLGVVRIPD